MVDSSQVPTLNPEKFEIDANTLSQEIMYAAD